MDCKKKGEHEDIFQSPISTHCFISSFLSELQGLENPRSSTASVRAPRSSSWQAPPVDQVKINVDVTVSRLGELGAVGALCRDHNGTYLSASTVVFRGITEPEVLESLAVREALALAEDLYVQRICVASDCNVVVDDIRQGSLASYGAIVHEIIARSFSFAICNIVHEFQSSNFEAHIFAKYALSLGLVVMLG